MTFYREGDRVNLDMATEDYNELMVLFGDLLAVVAEKDKALLYRGMKFVNQMNRTNSEFIRYDIPD